MILLYTQADDDIGQRRRELT